ncbi:hypothetical protein [Pseudomonas lactucae]
MTHAAHIASIEHELNGFHQSLTGSWAAIMDVWDSIKLVQAILENPLK